MNGISIRFRATVVFNTTPITGVKIWDRDGMLYYERNFAQPVQQFMVNIPDIGNYTIDAPVLSYEVLPLHQFMDIKALPARERSYNPNNTRIFFDPKMPDDGTPAKIYPARGEIHVSNKFRTLPIYQQKFILEHERGHMWYKTEEYCDIYAAQQMLRKGYNESSCIYALNRVLKRSPQKIQRMGFVFNNIIT